MYTCYWSLILITLVGINYAFSYNVSRINTRCTSIVYWIWYFTVCVIRSILVILLDVVADGVAFSDINLIAWVSFLLPRIWIQSFAAARTTGISSLTAAGRSWSLRRTGLKRIKISKPQVPESSKNTDKPSDCFKDSTELKIRLRPIIPVEFSFKCNR